MHAIVGGFHRNGPLFEPIIAPTCDALAELDLRLPRPHALQRLARHPRAGRPLPQRLPASQRQHPIRVSQRLVAASTHGAKAAALARAASAIRTCPRRRARVWKPTYAVDGAGVRGQLELRDVDGAFGEHIASGARGRRRVVPDRCPRVRRNRYGHEHAPRGRPSALPAPRAGSVTEPPDCRNRAGTRIAARAGRRHWCRQRRPQADPRCTARGAN